MSVCGDIVVSGLLQKLLIFMPKSVDVYVLEAKIGSGQFGDVFRGYSKIDGQDVAIKTIRRDKIKGKFTELLENEIQVLRSCKNNNIIRLIDIKKTLNNIYLVLQYCNQGDLLAVLKQRKKIPQEEALQYFVQILHAFQTLVKAKCMHRDFKLANVLKHDGVIKIGDFGFAKLLGSEDETAETILGSPLNMAPEILDHQPYNSKADIWSIGVAFYEMIFGKVPYTATNIIDLLKKIKKESLSFPLKVHPQIEDVLRKMLVVNPVQRIQWLDLFKHPVTRLLEDNLQHSLKLSMLCKKEQLPLNLSKFYIKTNKVVENVHDICAKKDLNHYVREAIHNQQQAPYQGSYIRRVAQRDNKQNLQDFKQTPTTQKQIKEEEPDSHAEVKALEATRIEKIKNTCSLILHERNTYAFLGHIAEDLIETHYNSYYQCLAFLLVKKAVVRLSNLLYSLKKHELKGVSDWSELQKTSQYRQLCQFVCSEEDIFNRLYEKLSLKVLEEGTLANFQEDLIISGKFTMEETNRRIFQKVLRQYIKRILGDCQQLPKTKGVQILKLLDTLRIDTKFSQGDFDFTGYYQQFQETEEQVITLNAMAKAQQLLSSAL